MSGKKPLIDRLTARLTELNKKHAAMSDMYDKKTADNFYGSDITDLTDTIAALGQMGSVLSKF
jgi:hypothetical protein